MPGFQFEIEGDWDGAEPVQGYDTPKKAKEPVREEPAPEPPQDMRLDATIEQRVEYLERMNKLAWEAVMDLKTKLEARHG